MAIPPPIQVGTIGMGDSLLLALIALVVLGPRRLPQVGRQIGKLMYEFRKASNDFKYQMEEEFRNAEEADRRKREEAERQRALAAAQTAVTQAQSAAEQALQAAAQAQTAAQAVQSAADGPQLQGAATALEAVPAADRFTDNVTPIQAPGYVQAMVDEPNAPPRLETKAPESSSTGLRILPPSTGEPVPASRRGRPGLPAQTTAESAPEHIPFHKPAVADELPAADETIAHHG